MSTTTKKKTKDNPNTLYPVPDDVIDWYRSHGKRKPTWHPTADLRNDICRELANGAKVMDTLESEDFPHPATFFRWIAAGNAVLEEKDDGKDIHPDIVALARDWSRARAARLERDLTEMGDIERRLIDEPQRITSEKVDAAGRQYPITNPNAIDYQAARIVLESRRWRLSRELPERFGDRSKVEHAGTVKVERPRDHMPEWMSARLEEEAAKTATDRPAAPQEPEKPAKTVH